jgi:hypothetical protein
MFAKILSNCRSWEHAANPAGGDTVFSAERLHGLKATIPGRL